MGFPIDLRGAPFNIQGGGHGSFGEKKSPTIETKKNFTYLRSKKEKGGSEKNKNNLDPPQNPSEKR